MKRYVITLTMLLAACGSEQQENDLDDINEKIQALSLITGSLDTIVRSDFASCPASGDTSDPLIRKICQVAQAATIELQIELQNQLANAVTAINGELDAINDDLASHQASLLVINASLTSLLADVASLNTRMTSAESAITALQNLTASITSTLNGTMQTVVIGEELVSAGPLYEIVMRRTDKKRFTGYVNAYGSSVSLANNPVATTNGSSTVTITSSAAHGLSVGDLILLADLTEGNGFTSGDVYGEFTVATVPTATTLTISLPRNATSNGSFGGTVGVVKKLNGRGMASLWASGQASDVAVRQTSAGSKTYNFIIRRIASDVSNDTAELCYSKVSATASFATINAAPEGGNATIACK